MNDKLIVVTIKVPGMKEIPTYNVEIEEKFRSKYHGEENENLFAISCPKCQGFVQVHVKLIPDQSPKLENDLEFNIMEMLEIKKEEPDPLQELPETPTLLSTKNRPVRRSSNKRPKASPKSLPKAPKKPSSECGKQSFLCDHCGRSYIKKSALEKHIIIHHLLGENLRVCPQCGVKVSKTKLNYHIKITHGPRLFECDLCPDRRRFLCKRSIGMHMRNKHWSERTIMCEFESCGKIFKTTRERKLHRDVQHKTDRKRLFACTFCPMKFYTKSQLKAHINVHGGEIRFSCKECGKGFHGRNKLKAHMVVHYPVHLFECKDCGKRFVRKEALIVHERIHSGVRDYVCTYPGCTSRFYDYGTLRQHKLFHVKRDKGLVNMRLPDVAKLHHRQGKFYWEEGYPKSDEERN